MVEISTSQAAEILGVTTARVIQLAESGKIRATFRKRNDRERGTWTVSKHDVEKRRRTALELRAEGREIGAGRPKAPEGYMTGRDVADYFGVTPETVRQWTRKGLLVAHSFGTSEYGRPLACYTCDDVEQFRPPYLDNPISIKARLSQGYEIVGTPSEPIVDEPIVESSEPIVESEPVASELDELKALVLNLAKTVQDLTADKA